MDAVTDKPGTLYSLCCFDRSWIVPEVQLFEAEDDQAALDMAKTMRPWMTREIWDRHRLVRVLPALWLIGTARLGYDTGSIAHLRWAVLS